MSDMYFENLPNTSTPITASNLNKLNDIKVSATTPTTGEKVWFKSGKNLIKSFTPGLLYNYSNNTYETGTPFSTSSFIDVVVGETYIFSHALNSAGGSVACFDENETYLEYINLDNMLSAFTITNSNCRKILCISYDGNNNPSQNETWMQLEVGSTATSYEPYIEKEIYIKNNDNMYEKFIKETNNNYSLNETKIGMCNGKPLYRKMYVVTGTPIPTTITHGINGLDKIVNYHGSIVFANDFAHPFPVIYSPDMTQYGGSLYSYDNNNLYLSLGAISADSKKLELIIEYTKTSN